MRSKFHKTIIKKFTRKIDAFPGYVEKNKIYIIPTKEGIIFFISIFAIFLGSINENNNMGLLFSFFLFSIFVITLFDTRKNILGIKINNIEVEDAFADSISKVLVSLDSGEMERVAIRIDLNENFKSTNISWNNSKTIDLEIKGKTRGVFTLPHILLSSRYPLGIFKAQSYLFPDCRQIVYPKPSKSSYIDHKGQSINGIDGNIKENSSEDEFKGLREYIKGDSFKRISWKSFSKGLGLHVKDFDSGKAEYDEVIIDINRVDGNNIEEQLSIMCRAVLELDLLGIRYGMRTDKIFIPPSTGGKHRLEALRSLAFHGEN